MAETNVQPLRVAVIGTGFGARVQLPGFLGYAETNVVALCGASEKKTKEIAAQYGVRAVYTDYEQMLVDVKPDVVSIVTPPKLALTHMTMAALQIGRACAVRKTVCHEHRTRRQEMLDEASTSRARPHHRSRIPLPACPLLSARAGRSGLHRGAGAARSNGYDGIALGPPAPLELVDGCRTGRRDARRARIALYRRLPLADRARSARGDGFAAHDTRSTKPVLCRMAASERDVTSDDQRDTDPGNGRRAARRDQPERGGRGRNACAWPFTAQKARWSSQDDLQLWGRRRGEAAQSDRRPARIRAAAVGSR